MMSSLIDKNTAVSNFCSSKKFSTLQVAKWGKSEKIYKTFTIQALKS